MGTTHLYQIDSTKFDYSFGYPLQDDASTGLVTMLYGLDKRANSTDVETDLGTARQMINQSELPYARNVPLRTIIAQMLEEIPGVLIYPIGDPWHLSGDVNKAIGSYIYTILTSDCTLPGDTVCSDSIQWRTWMAHKIGQETAWNLMYLQGANSCNKFIDYVTACDAYQWINGITYTTSNSTATYTYTNFAGCDSLVILNLTISAPNTMVTQTGAMLTANQQGATYQWLNCSAGTLISGANSQSYLPSSNGNYSVIVTYNGCSDTSTCYNINIVSVMENNFGDEIQLYPNPTNENVTIDLGSSFSDVTVIVRNSLGQELIHKNYLTMNRIDLKIEGVSGIYFITITSDNKNAILKVIKK